MDKRTNIIIAVIALMGVAFAGYLTFTKFVLGVCPLAEPCPIFLGQPACVFGLVMFGCILLLSVYTLFARTVSKTVYQLRLGIAIIGVIFSGYFTVQELFFAQCPGGVCIYTLGLPTCVYGLVMYVGIVVASVWLRGHSE